MKKFLIVAIMLVFASMVFAGAAGQSNFGAVNATTPKVLLMAGAYTISDIQITYNSMTYTSNDRFYVEDAANTYTAAAQTITLTAKSLIGETGNFKFGTTGLASNASGVGVIYGVKFTKGVVLDGGTDAGTGSVTITASVNGK